LFRESFWFRLEHSPCGIVVLSVSDVSEVSENPSIFPRGRTLCTL
jgi:hypothetical protein